MTNGVTKALKEHNTYAQKFVSIRKRLGSALIRQPELANKVCIKHDQLPAGTETRKSSAGLYIETYYSSRKSSKIKVRHSICYNFADKKRHFCTLYLLEIVVSISLVLCLVSPKSKVATVIVFVVVVNELWLVKVVKVGVVAVDVVHWEVLIY